LAQTHSGCAGEWLISKGVAGLLGVQNLLTP